MKADKLIKACEQALKDQAQEAEKGHDWFHIERVRRNALFLQEREGGDRHLIELAALLHDIDDAKFNGGDEEAGARAAKAFLKGLGAEGELSERVADLVARCSFKGGVIQDSPEIELQILRDADRLDAIGAIGIARTFHYGGYKNQAIYDPHLPVREKLTLKAYREGKSTTINHFYEKLLKLKDGMYTKTASKLAEERHQFMESFLKQFYSEWSLFDDGALD